MNLSDDLTPAADPAPLLRAVRRHRRARSVTRACISGAAVVIAAIALWPRTTPRPPEVTAAPALTPAPKSVSMTREELIDSLKDETFALIQWPDGREQLLIRR